uniref:hypothetical protein n=1 Tax=Castellaniella defragrans TaxID=75697 RepID=UPI0033410EB9
MIAALAGWRGYAAAALVAGAAAWAVQGWRWEARTARTERDNAVVLAQYQQAATEASERARAAEQKIQEGIENVRTEYQSIVEQTALVAAAAGAESVSLRDDLAAANRRAEREAARAGSALDANARIAAELRDVVGMCAARYTDLAAEADRLRGDLMGLQGYVRAVQGSNQQ